MATTATKKKAKANPNPQLAYALDSYFSSTNNTDTPEIPAPKPGILNPWAPGQAGLRAWRKEWRAVSPARASASFWNPGLRRLQASATTPVGGSYFPVNNNLLALNVWDLAGDHSAPPSSSIATLPKGIPAAYVQIATTLYDADSPNGTYIPPDQIFTGYYWGEEGKSAIQKFPVLPPGVQCASLALPAGIVISVGPGGGSSGGHHRQAGPDTTQLMNTGRLATLQFGKLPGTPAKPCSIHIQIGVYLQLTPPGGGQALYVFDDPEMDATSP